MKTLCKANVQKKSGTIKIESIKDLEDVIYPMYTDYDLFLNGLGINYFHFFNAFRGDLERMKGREWERKSQFIYDNVGFGSYPWAQKLYDKIKYEETK
jgi:hypothetical protein